MTVHHFAFELTEWQLLVISLCGVLTMVVCIVLMIAAYACGRMREMRRQRRRKDKRVQAHFDGRVAAFNRQWPAAPRPTDKEYYE